MTKTLQERFALALEHMGETRVESRSGKYITYTRSSAPGTFYFLGYGGALRVGKCASKSIPAHDKFKNRLLNPLFGLDI
jgi:hypothetical protein